jgi:hypothetical protein
MNLLTEVHVWMSRCEKVMMMAITFFEVAKFISLTPIIINSFV